VSLVFIDVLRSVVNAFFTIASRIVNGKILEGEGKIYDGDEGVLDDETISKV
jgi:hypothetical protein